MMLTDFIAKDSTRRVFDLDGVVEVVRGFSRNRVGWTAIIVYDLSQDVFIEIRSTPPDVRGLCLDESEQVSDEYVADACGNTSFQIESFRQNPRIWKLIDLRV